MLSFFIHIILLGFIGTTDPVGADWRLVNDRNNIKVYVKKEDNSSFKEVKIEGVIQTSMSELIACIEDVPRHKTWVTRTIDSRFVNRHSQRHFVYYLSTDMPFPVRDREIFIEYRRDIYEKGRYVVTESHETKSAIPVDAEMVRIPDYYSKYELRDLGDGRILLQYHMKVDPGGLLPAWLVNLAVTKGPIETIEALFELVRSGKYAGVQLEGL